MKTMCLPTVTAVAAIKHMDITISTEHDVADMLQAKGVEVKSIDSVFFSHWHFDHVGDATRFPGTTRIVVGPGFKSNFLPGYPSDRNSMICGDGLDDQRVQELGFSESSLSIASMPAIDWFGDGSFYLLSTPGHAVGHISALARTTSGTAPGSESSFVFLAGDVCHHTGELRPHPGHPLPETLPCFGDTKDKFKSTSEYLTIHPEHSADRPFYRPSCGGFNLDSEQMQETLEKVALLDADSRVFTMLAHDHWLLSVVDHFPETVNTWKETGWAERSRWRFLQDFE